MKGKRRLVITGKTKTDWGRDPWRLFQLDLRNMLAGDDNQTNKPTGHVDFDGCALAFRLRLVLFGSGFDGGGCRKAVFE